MIKLIVGLGNPGQQYEKTRHNVGFLFLDALVSEFGGSWINEVRFQGLLAEIVVAGCKVMLLKPTTFMNRSGGSVGKLIRYYKLLPEEILVVHDELDFAPGIAKLKMNGGHAGHNGLRDIIAHLGSSDFYRLRIGIGRPSAGAVMADFVLSSPSKADLKLLVGVFDDCQGFLNQVVGGDMAAVMNALNGSCRLINDGLEKNSS